MPGRKREPSFQLASGTTNERDNSYNISNTLGSIFYNTDTSNVEVYHEDLSNTLEWRDLVMNNKEQIDISGKLVVDGDVSLNSGMITFPDGTSQATAATTAATTNPFNHIQTAANDVINVVTSNPPYDSTATSGTKLTALSGLKITPKSTSQKVFLQLHLFGEWSANSHSCSVSFKRVVGVTETWLDARNTVSGGIGNKKPCNAVFSIQYDRPDTQSTPESLNTVLIDEPTTTQEVTYDVYLINTAGNATYSLNRTTDAIDDQNRERGISTFTAECKG